MFLLLLCEHLAGHRLNKESEGNSYYFVDERIDGEMELMTCYENPVSANMDFDLSASFLHYRKILLSSDNVDTENPVKCNSYPLEWMNPANRYHHIPAMRDGWKRVAFVGNSVVFGEGIPMGYAFPELINGYLDLYGNPQKWISLNYGLMSHALDDIYNYSFRSSLSSEPDLIVFILSPEDANKDELYRVRPRDKERSKNKSPLVSLIQNYIMREKNIREYVEHLKTINNADHPRRNSEITDLLMKMQREAREAGADFKVVFFPAHVAARGKYQLGRENEFIADIITNTGIETLDLTDSILSFPAERIRTSPVASAPGFFAHRRVAKSLIKAIAIPTTTDVETGLKRNFKQKIGKGHGNNELGGTSGISLAVFIFLSVMYVFFATGVVLNAKEVFKELFNGGRAGPSLFLALAALALFMRLVLAPEAHLDSEEIIRLNFINHWISGRYSVNTLAASPGVLFYYYFFFKIFGINGLAAKAASLTASIFSIIFFYSALKKIFKDEKIILPAIIIFAVFPASIRFSLTQVAENPILLFQAAALCAGVINAKKSGFSSLVFLLSSLSILMFSGIYNLLFVLLSIWFHAVLSKDYKKALVREEGAGVIHEDKTWNINRLKRRLHDYIITLFIFVTAVVFLFYSHGGLMSARGHWNLFSLKTMSESARVAFLFMADNKAMPLIIVTFTLVGMTVFVRRGLEYRHWKRTIIFFAAWFFTYFACHIVNLAQNYNTKSDFDLFRQSIEYMLPLCILSALGINNAVKMMSVKAGRIFICLTLMIIVGIPFLHHKAISYDTIFTSIQRIMKEEVKNYPPDTVFLTDMFEIYGLMKYEYGADFKYSCDTGDCRPFCGESDKCVDIILSDSNIYSGFWRTYGRERCYSKYGITGIYLAFCDVRKNSEEDYLKSQDQNTSLEWIRYLLPVFP
jgi:hypothetical protein